jgi:hypothetical protein
MTSETKTAAAVTGVGTVLMALAAGQFLMALDSSVMNVSTATVAADLNTPIMGIPLGKRPRRAIMSTTLSRVACHHGEGPAHRRRACRSL